MLLCGLGLGWGAPAQAATQPYTVAVQLSRPAIVADGVSPTVATATVTDSGNQPVPGEPVTITVAGGPTIGAVTDNGDGTYSATITASTAAGTYTVTASDPNATSLGTTTLTQLAGPAAVLTLQPLSPSLVPVTTGVANAIATVTDMYGNPVTGDILTLSGPTGTTAMPPTDSTGTTSAQVLASSTPGQQTVTASDGGLTSSATLTQYGPPATITIQSATPSSVTAGQTAAITASVLDSAHDPVPVDSSLTVSSNGLSAPMTPGGTPGAYTGTTPPLTRAGADTVTVADLNGALPGSATVSVAPGARSAMSFLGGFIPPSIPADHNSTASIQISITDAYGNGVSGETPSVSSNDAGQAVSWADNGGGTYTITVRSSYSPASSLISVTDGVKTLTKSLGQTSAATGIGLSLASSRLTADGRSRTTATITLHDRYGAPLPGDARSLSLSASDPHVGIGHVTDLGSGDYAVTVTSSVSAHPVALTASETAIHLSASTGLLLLAGAPAELSVHITPGVLTANGLATAGLTLSLADAHGNPIAGASPQLRATPAGVHFRALTDLGGGHYAGTLRASNVPGTITVSARDGAAVGATTLTETAAPTVLATTSMQWSFRFTRTYTAVEALNLTGAPVGSRVIEICQRDRGCPFHRRVAATVRPVRCAKAHRGSCPSASDGVDIARGLRLRRLHPGAVLVVQIVRRGWIGKYYAFRVRGGQAPQITISCLPPGGSHPGAGCQ